MKRSFTFLFLLCGFNVSAQPNRLIDSIYQNMQQVRSLQYRQITRKFYRDDNYRASDTLLLFLETGPGTLPRYQVKDAASGKTWIYNGKQSFLLNSRNHTMDIDGIKETASLDRNFFWRQSWANLLRMMPEIRNAVTSQHQISSDASFHRIRFHFPGKRLAALNGFSSLGTDSIQWQYEIVVNRQQLLPVAFNVSIQTPSNRENYIRVQWEDMQLNPPPLPELSWYSSTYLNEYPKTSAPRKNMIAKGAMMPRWQLPVYGRSDSLSADGLKDQLTLLYFWQKNCGVCMASFPKVNELQSQFESSRFRLITINCYDTRDEVGFFFQKYHPAYTMCYEGLPLAETLGIFGYPMAILVDRNGTVLDAAPFDQQALTQKIGEALNK